MKKTTNSYYGLRVAKHLRSATVFIFGENNILKGTMKITCPPKTTREVRTEEINKFLASFKLSLP